MRFEKPGSPGNAAGAYKSVKIQFNIVLLLVIMKRTQCVTLHAMLPISTIRQPGEQVILPDEMFLPPQPIMGSGICCV